MSEWLHAGPGGTRVDGVPAVSAVDVHKTYVGGDGRPLHVLAGVNLEVAAGESVAIIGQSGVGKSTLLHLIGGLDLPTVGEVRVAGRSLRQLTAAELARLRNREIGFVFQFHHLLREFTALENVMMPLMIGGTGRAAARDRARALLEDVGLGSRSDHRPQELSGGEQQRVAVARALVTQPRVVLADEPSGNLDPPTAARLHDLFFDVSREHGAAVILVTHNLELAARADRLLRLEQGGLMRDLPFEEQAVAGPGGADGLLPSLPAE